MALKLRPTGLGAGIDKDRRTTPSTLASGRSAASTKVVGGPDRLRWFWSMTVNGPMTRSGRVATLEEARAQLRKSWDAWKAWANLEEID